MEKLPEKVGPFVAVKNFFRYYARFSGRSSRTEYWYPWIAGQILPAYYVLINTLEMEPDTYGLLLAPLVVLTYLVLPASVVPSLSIMSRRLRDGGISPYFLFFVFLPVLGWLALFVMMMFPSKPTTT